MEAGSGLSHEEKLTLPEDILVNWCINGKPAAFDHSISSQLKPDIVSEAGHMAGSVTTATEQCMLLENSKICDELVWLELHSHGSRILWGLG